MPITLEQILSSFTFQTHQEGMYHGVNVPLTIKPFQSELEWNHLRKFGSFVLLKIRLAYIVAP